MFNSWEWLLIARNHSENGFCCSIAGNTFNWELKCHNESRPHASVTITLASSMGRWWRRMFLQGRWARSKMGKDRRWLVVAAPPLLSITLETIERATWPEWCHQQPHVAPAWCIVQIMSLLGVNFCNGDLRGCPSPPAISLPNEDVWVPRGSSVLLPLLGSFISWRRRWVISLPSKLQSWALQSGVQEGRVPSKALSILPDGMRSKDDSTNHTQGKASELTLLCSSCLFFFFFPMSPFFRNKKTVRNIITFSWI